MTIIGFLKIIFFETIAFMLLLLEQGYHVCIIVDGFSIFGRTVHFIISLLLILVMILVPMGMIITNNYREKTKWRWK